MSFRIFNITETAGHNNHSHKQSSNHRFLLRLKHLYRPRQILSQILNLRSSIKEYRQE